VTRGPISAAVIVAALLQALAGCTQQAPKPTTTSEAPKEPPAPPPPQPPAVKEQPPAAPPTSPAPSPPPRSLEGFVDEPALKDVLFDRDRADILSNGATIMMSNARWLLARWLVDNRDYLVLIEGHTDNRGTRDEKQAIAELRAKAAASFLASMGLPDSRLLTVSYSSDRPLCTDRSEACAARNRRVHFRVKMQ
jgi:outer membrane protein OmpA-like peptidoglycan-associated protein